MDAVSLALEEIESLRKCLYYSTIEKESLRTTALTELREKEERVNQLCLLLKQTTHERDEVRNHLHQLQLLLHKLTQQPVDPSPPTNPIWANSSLIDSDNLSSDSAFDEIDRTLAEMDRADRLVKVRALPEKGRLMQAVTDAGPLLKNCSWRGRSRCGGIRLHLSSGCRSLRSDWRGGFWVGGQRGQCGQWDRRRRG
ncbi:hypothetical protein QJS10_CPA03g01496 [Acorus calamus]|uniref:Uncharacterized protein n=1 Tax=Acorus calamus TaxID=4465 RepID=A0AAV9F6C6_ACOCL|nr:hypothetical protein QJS10_CPA03g01496 [Acorus calamus]